ncbi:MAG: bifunctional glutamate N-acetyltransferase/amino-acid acetyltransferase ArgJ [Proteobacteria bacterium]|nr:bifunctional glutamate N-acetyltransferase/amino-acid acetyltransferase ArgJ [Pseudomonadota bacterium]
MSHPVSPLAPAELPPLSALAGVRLAAGAAGIRYQGRTDVLLVELAPGTTVGGVFTKSLTRSAPVDWCREALAGGRARALVVNAGNANAFTGKAGWDAMEAVIKAAAETLNCRPSRVFAASTGIIGQVLPAEPFIGKLAEMTGRLAEDGWSDAAQAIMTTDTFAKAAIRETEIAGTPVRIVGIVKGSGMIAPDMATMLGFIATDAALPAPILQTLLGRATELSFNAITVDSDTSTSDTVLMFATGAAGNGPLTDAADSRLGDFQAALESLCVDLAQQVVRDGEGATKFVTVAVSGAENDGSAKKIAFAIANSPLVKTAIAGEDANWGRIVAAVGKAGEPADRDKLAVSVGGITIARDGSVVIGYDETPVAAHMKGQEIDIAVDIGLGAGKATVWTCDLTHGYISINADYRS